MRPGAVGTTLLSRVGRVKPNHQATRRQGVLDRELERERIAGLRNQTVGEQHPMGLLFPQLPGDPAGEAVQRVPQLRLGQRQLMPLPAELVAAVFDAIGPRNEQLPSRGCRQFGAAIAVDDVALFGRVRAQAAAGLDDDGVVSLERDLELSDSEESVCP